MAKISDWIGGALAALILGGVGYVVYKFAKGDWKVPKVEDVAGAFGGGFGGTVGVVEGVVSGGLSAAGSALGGLMSNVGDITQKTIQGIGAVFGLGGGDGGGTVSGDAGVGDISGGGGDVGGGVTLPVPGFANQLASVLTGQRLQYQQQQPQSTQYVSTAEHWIQPQGAPLPTNIFTSLQPVPGLSEQQAREVATFYAAYHEGKITYAQLAQALSVYGLSPHQQKVY